MLIASLAVLGMLPDAPAQTAADPTQRNFHFDVKHVDQYNQLLPSQSPEALAIVLGLIPGKLFGSPVGQPLVDQELADSRRFELDLDRYGDRADGDAAALEDGAARSGLVVAPQATRFARVATFAANAVTRRLVGHLGFVDSISREPLLLVYFDRPCRVSGVVRFGRDEYAHEVTVPRRGFHWLRVFETSRGQFSIRNWLGTEDLFLAIRPSP